MKSIGGRLRGREKAKRRKVWDWIRSKTERHILLLHWWVQDSQYLKYTEILFEGAR